MLWDFENDSSRLTSIRDDALGQRILTPDKSKILVQPPQGFALFRVDRNSDASNAIVITNYNLCEGTVEWRKTLCMASAYPNPSLGPTCVKHVGTRQCFVLGRFSSAQRDSCFKLLFDRKRDDVLWLRLEKSAGEEHSELRVDHRAKSHKRLLASLDPRRADAKINIATLCESPQAFVAPDTTPIPELPVLNYVAQVSAKLSLPNEPQTRASRSARILGLNASSLTLRFLDQNDVCHLRILDFEEEMREAE